MIESELQELVRKIQFMKCETQVIELKAAHKGCPKKLYDSLSAFSNQDMGGTIIFGIDEEKDYKIVGVYDAQDLQKKVNEQCKQMKPEVRPIFTCVIMDEKCVVSAEIPGIDITERPCYYGGVGRIKGSYIRSGDSDEPMSDYEIYSYEAFRKKYQDDIRVNDRATLETIDMVSMEKYISIVKERSPKLARLPEKDIWRFLNMIVDDKPTLLCILLFSIYPQMFYPQYTINATVVPGYKKGEVSDDGSRFLDNVRIEGTIDEVLGQAIKFLRSNMKVRTVIEPKTGKRKDKTEYPVVALREAVLNALIHRDYSIHTEAMPIEMTMYKDRIEICNPGGLYGRLSLDTLGKVHPDTRNPALARALETLGITENRYSGIPTIQRELRQAGLKEAVFFDSRNEFKVIFYNEENPMFNVELKESDMILEFCREPRSRREIADMLGISTIYYVTQNYINPLIESGKLQMTRPQTPKSKKQKFYSTIIGEE